MITWYSVVCLVEFLSKICRIFGKFDRVRGKNSIYGSLPVCVAIREAIDSLSDNGGYGDATPAGFTLDFLQTSPIEQDLKTMVKHANTVTHAPTHTPRGRAKRVCGR